jgi:adenosylhomocysteinase
MKVEKTEKKMKKLVYDVPEEIDKNVAPLKLQCLNVKIDKLTGEQKKYPASWEMGT